jgi:two-component system CheB/CheR fusion protein
VSEGLASETCPPIVGIGGSAGGIEAFHGFFESMRSDSGLAFVVVLHLPAHRESILPEILTRWTAMPVIVVSDGCLVEPNHVYVPPSGASIVLRGRRLHLPEANQNEPREHSPISVFFDSLASALGEDAIGVVLSGTGNDGALGLKAIKAHGGLTLAQGGDGLAAQGDDPGQTREHTGVAAESVTNASGPRHEGMPASAIAIGAVDIVAPAEAMAGHILAVRRMRREAQEIDDTSEQANAARLTICSVLRRQLGHDFSVQAGGVVGQGGQAHDLHAAPHTPQEGLFLIALSSGHRWAD